MPTSPPPLSLRLDPETLQQLEQLQARLHHPTRAALLRYLLSEGIAAALRQLEAAR